MGQRLTVNSFTLSNIFENYSLSTTKETRRSQRQYMAKSIRKNSEAILENGELSGKDSVTVCTVQEGRAGQYESFRLLGRLSPAWAVGLLWRDAFDRELLRTVQC